MEEVREGEYDPSITAGWADTLHNHYHNGMESVNKSIPAHLNMPQGRIYLLHLEWVILNGAPDMEPPNMFSKIVYIYNIVNSET